MYKGDCVNCPYVNLYNAIEMANELDISFSELHKYLCKNIDFGYINKLEGPNVSQIKCVNYNKYKNS